MSAFWVSTDLQAMTGWITEVDNYFNDTYGVPEECPSIPGLYRVDVAVQIRGEKLADAVPLPGDSATSEIRWIRYDDPAWQQPGPPI